MKDQYVGDVNDYLKYGLLRALQAARQDPLYVCWMLTPDDAGPDGAKLAYLKQPEKYRAADPSLYEVSANSSSGTSAQSRLSRRPAFYRGPPISRS